MTTPDISSSPASVGKGSRALRMSQPRTIDVLRNLAVEYGVCVNPQPVRMVDPVTGQTTVYDVNCDNSLSSKCPSCAARKKKLRQVQCRDGWHRTDEPITPELPTEEQQELVSLRAELEALALRAELLGEWEEAEACRADIARLDERIPITGLRGLPGKPKNRDPDGGHRKRRVRSTKRRQDVPDLPRVKMTPRTIGRSYIGRDGKVHTPSMALTMTLGSYGRVRRSDGTPVDFDSYDYRRAARDAIFFPKLLDRFWQNLRRAVGFKVQYFGCVEPQRRLAPHAHFAVRGTFPRRIFRAVVAGTYHNVWQPFTDTVVFPEDGPQPEWYDPGDGTPAGYINPHTGQFLPTWDEANDALDQLIDADLAGPYHVVRFGEQAYEDIFDDHPDQTHPDSDGDDELGAGWVPEGRMGVQGMESGTRKAEAAIRYLTKYITKAVDECHRRTTPREIEHHRRFQEALRFEPCSPRCANWLRYGIQPDHARPGMVAGRCRGRVHQTATLGIGGRRILVSRDWSGKTLADHKADQTTWVRKILALGLNHQLGNGNQAVDGAGQLVDEHGQPILPLSNGETEHEDQGDEHQGQERERGGELHGEPVDGGQLEQPARKVRWERAKPGDHDVPPLAVRLWRNVGAKIRRRVEWQTALAQLQLQDSEGPPGDVSATTASARAGEAA